MTDPKGFLARVEQAWRDRAALPDGRKLTRLHVHVAAKLAYWRSADPRHRLLAAAARCSTRTVRRALDILHKLGLLTWTRRVIYCRGWRAQISNTYEAASFPKPLSFLPIRIKSSAALSPPGMLQSQPGAAWTDAPLLAARRKALDDQNHARYAAAVRRPLLNSAMFLQFSR